MVSPGFARLRAANAAARMTEACLTPEEVSWIQHWIGGPIKPDGSVQSLMTGLSADGLAELHGHLLEIRPRRADEIRGAWAPLLSE